MKTTLLPLIACMTMFAAPAAFGWTLTITNNTRYLAVLEIHYESLCDSDYPQISPNTSVTINAKHCRLFKIAGVLVPTIGDTSKNIHILPWSSSSGIAKKDTTMSIKRNVRGVYYIDDK